MSTRFKYSLDPSEGIDLGFFVIRFYSPDVCNCFWLGLVHHEKYFQRENESVDKLDTLFIWTVLATLVGVVWAMFCFMTGNITAIIYWRSFAIQIQPEF